MNIRNLTFLALCIFAFACCTNEQTSLNEEKKRPNILFLIADDWSYPHASIYGDPVLKTPTFDRIAQEGALYHNAYCSSPSCSPSRAAILTSRYPHALESAGNLWSIFPSKFPNFVKLLGENGYHTGKMRKGWAPGDFKAGGYEENPAGQNYPNFERFYSSKEENKPFCFWFGSSDPHRDYRINSGIETGMDLNKVNVPGFLPDNACIRNDLLDYYFEIERFDRECGQILDFLESKGELDNTLIIMTSDNGMPFPRAKANLYDYGTRMPLAMRYPHRIKAGLQIERFFNFVQFAPSILELAEIKIPEEMMGKSIWEEIDEKIETEDFVILERERHANVRKGDLSYPMRAIRTREYLYIRNFYPERWPAGDPEVHQSVGQYGDIDNSISKFLLMNMKDSKNSKEKALYELSFGKRNAEELYDIRKDPYQLDNIVGNPEYKAIRQELFEKLENWMQENADIRYKEPQSVYWDTVLYTPDYQHKNFNLQAEILNYKIRPPIGPYSEDGIGCYEKITQ